MVDDGAPRISAVELGTGVGSHREIYPIYFDGQRNVEYTHAESGYLQVLVETGMVGAGLLVVAMGCCAAWCWRSVRAATSGAKTACGVALSGPIVVSAVHSIWDFVWYIPACMTFTIILAACACRLSQFEELPPSSTRNIEASRTLTRKSGLFPSRTLAAISAILLVGVMTWSQFSAAMAGVHWDRYLRQSLAAEKSNDGNVEIAT